MRTHLLGAHTPASTATYAAENNARVSETRTPYKFVNWAYYIYNTCVSHATVYDRLHDSIVSLYCIIVLTYTQPVGVARQPTAFVACYLFTPLSVPTEKRFRYTIFVAVRIRSAVHARVRFGSPPSPTDGRRVAKCSKTTFTRSKLYFFFKFSFF